MMAFKMGPDEAGVDDLTFVLLVLLLLLLLSATFADSMSPST